MSPLHLFWSYDPGLEGNGLPTTEASYRYRDGPLVLLHAAVSRMRHCQPHWGVCDKLAKAEIVWNTKIELLKSMEFFEVRLIVWTAVQQAIAEDSLIPSSATPSLTFFTVETFMVHTFTPPPLLMIHHTFTPLCSCHYTILTCVNPYLRITC